MEYTYFFEGNSMGYTIWIEDVDNENADEIDKQRSSLSDGITRVNDINRYGQRVEFIRFDGQVGDLVFGIEKPITYRGLKEFFGVEPLHGHFLFWRNGDEYLINVGTVDERGTWTPYDNDDLVRPNSRLSMSYYRDGNRTD
jgi:hypothetical protein